MNGRVDMAAAQGQVAVTPRCSAQAFAAQCVAACAALYWAAYHPTAARAPFLPLALTWDDGARPVSGAGDVVVAGNCSIVERKRVVQEGTEGGVGDTQGEHEGGVGTALLADEDPVREGWGGQQGRHLLAWPVADAGRYATSGAGWHSGKGCRLATGGSRRRRRVGSGPGACQTPGVSKPVPIQTHWSMASMPPAGCGAALLP